MEVDTEPQRQQDKVGRNGPAPGVITEGNYPRLTPEPQGLPAKLTSSYATIVQRKQWGNDPEEVAVGDSHETLSPGTTRSPHRKTDT